MRKPKPYIVNRVFKSSFTWQIMHAAPSFGLEGGWLGFCKHGRGSIGVFQNRNGWWHVKELPGQLFPTREWAAIHGMTKQREDRERAKQAKEK